MLDEVDGDDQLYYADHFERQLAEIDPECFENIFGESDGEDFYGTVSKQLQQLNTGR